MCFLPDRSTLELKNRFVLAPMGSSMAQAEMITDPFIKYQILRAKGGVGLNTVEYTTVNQPREMLISPLSTRTV
ncbi:hypothetical protein AMQ84_01385 [Paenibacillus riograndensis]|uniref:NADH:flavin oxidoreductase/NADH oxidase N-terminal domain-containing protein n=1 Tax=Paenibacillus riograndensis TaxID=483937 RepID=A0A132UBR5_9BACL|nr:hypothetical protein AMQ84_01385 [Paenibacillus riograndensis]